MFGSVWMRRVDIFHKPFLLLQYKNKKGNSWLNKWANVKIIKISEAKKKNQITYDKMKSEVWIEWKLKW